MKIFVVLIVFISLLAAIDKTKEPLDIKAEINNYMSSTNFGYIDFIIKNNSDEWKELKDIKITFSEEKITKNTTFLYGNYFNLWLEATERRNKIDDTNRRMWKSALVAVGGALLSVGGNQNSNQLGGTLVAGAGLMQMQDFYKNYTDLKRSGLFPKSHIFGDSMLIPPNMEIARFVVLQSKNHKEMGFVNNMTLEYTVADNKVKKQITFREPQFKEMQVI